MLKLPGRRDDQKKFSEEFGKGRKREINTSKFGKEQGNELLHVVDIADELAVQQPKILDGRRLKSARKDGFDLGDGDDELKVENGMEDCCVVVDDMPGAPENWHEVMERQVPNIQSTQKTVEVPRVQFIDRVVDDPAVMQKETFNVEARELIEDDSVGGKQQGPERTFE